MPHGSDPQNAIQGAEPVQRGLTRNPVPAQDGYERFVPASRMGCAVICQQQVVFRTDKALKCKVGGPVARIGEFSRHRMFIARRAIGLAQNALAHIFVVDHRGNLGRLTGVLGREIGHQAAKVRIVEPLGQDAAVSPKCHDLRVDVRSYHCAIKHGKPLLRCCKTFPA